MLNRWPVHAVIEPSRVLCDGSISRLLPFFSKKEGSSLMFSDDVQISNDLCQTFHHLFNSDKLFMS